MLYRALADITVVVHVGFVLFVLVGGFAVLRWPKMAWVHLPAAAWGVAIELIGWVCPLTYLENYFRDQGNLAGYHTSFVEQYVLPLIYPDILFDGQFPPYGFVLIGLFVLVLNAGVYWRVLCKYRKA